MTRTIAITIAMLILATGVANAQGSTGLTATQIYDKAQMTLYYPGDDMKANITMELISDGGGVQTREMNMLRIDDSDGGDQKYFVYFKEPGDVRRMTFMVWKYSASEDDRWIFVPAVDLVRRIAADDKYSSFVGSDFSYEDVSGRGSDSDNHTLLRTETFNGSECYVVQSIPKESAPYTKQISWIDSTNFIPLKQEYYDAQNELSRVFTADKVETISGFPTVSVRTMENVKSGHSTVVTYNSTEYNLGLSDGDFSERYMRNPPRDWTD